MAKFTCLVSLFLISTPLNLVLCHVDFPYPPTIRKCCPQDQLIVFQKLTPNNPECRPRSLPKKDCRLEIGFPDCANADQRHTHYGSGNFDNRVMPSSDGQLYLEEYQLLLPAGTFCVDETEYDGSFPIVIHYCFETLSSIHKCCPEGSAITFVDKGIQCDNFSVTLHPWQITSGFPDCTMYSIDPENTEDGYLYFLPSGQLLLPSMGKNPNVIIKEYCVDYVLENGSLSTEVNALICFGAANAIYPCFSLIVLTAIYGELAIHL